MDGLGRWVLAPLHEGSSEAPTRREGDVGGAMFDRQKTYCSKQISKSPWYHSGKPHFGDTTNLIHHYGSRDSICRGVTVMWQLRLLCDDIQQWCDGMFSTEVRQRDLHWKSRQFDSCVAVSSAI